ncbi:MAG TPA: hypothetical protein VD813_14605, partial [Pseudonocardia sp.]|nr:hypothetical protein [Pseudonocardia sp.]
HLLTLGAMVTCGWLAVWQWQKAGSALGTALNVGYGLQWPVFAIFFGFMWWRMLRLEARALREKEASAAGETDHEAPHLEPEPEPEPESRPSEPSPFTRTPRRAAAVPAEVDPVLAEYNRMLARLAARDQDDR